MRPQPPASPSFPPGDAYPMEPRSTPTAARADWVRARPQPLARMLAMLCYSIPLAPSLWLLWRERRERFVRFHAAQALVVFALIAAGQTAIWLLLLLAGSVVHDTLLASGAAVIVVALFAALGLGALLLWWRLVGDCLEGRARRLPLAGKWADRLEHLTARPVRR